MSAKQAACQNMMLAVLFISFILLMVPLTIFSKPLQGLDKSLYLLLPAGVLLWHHPSLLEVAEVALDRGGIVGIRPRMDDRHLQPLYLSTYVCLLIVPGIVHQYQGVLSPEWALRV